MITQQSIETRSYHIWEHEGRPHGRHLDHWFRAEAELRSQTAVEAEPQPARKAAAKKAVAGDKKTSAAPVAAPVKPAKRATKRKQPSA